MINCRKNYADNSQAGVCRWESPAWNRARVSEAVMRAYSCIG